MIQTHLLLLLLLAAHPAPAPALEKAEDALRRANSFADVYQWGSALPLFIEAERDFQEAGDSARAAYARVGRIRSSIKEPPERTHEDLNREIKHAPWASDSSLRLGALFLKADMDTDIDAIGVRPFDAKQRRRDWQEILAISQKLGDRHLEARAQRELGLIKVLEGNPVGSDELGNALWQAKGSGDIRNELRFRTAIARLYLMVGRPQDALGHLGRSVELADSEQAFSYSPAYFEEAVALLTDHRLDAALPLVDHCAAQARNTEAVAIKSQDLYLRGRVCLERGQTSEALDLFKHSLELATDFEYHRLVSGAAMKLSQIYRSRGELWKASDLAELGLKAALKTGDPTEVILQMHNQGTIRTDQGQLAEAEHLYGEAVQALDALLVKFTSAYARAFFVSRMSDLYSDYFSLCLLNLKDPAKAFSILEQARGRGISDSIRGRWSDHEPGTNAAAQSAFEKPLARLQAKLWYKEDSLEFRTTLNEIFDLEQQLGPSRETGRHSVVAQTYSPVPLSEIQKVLYPDEVILEYVLHAPSSTCLAITRSGVQGVALAPRRVIEESITEYRSEILQGRSGAEIAHRLYDLLLAPIAGLDGKLRITIVPDGLLNLLPVESILTPSGQPMIISHMIDYSPSATVTWLLRKLPARATGRPRFLGVGDARYPSPDEAGHIIFANVLQPALLPGSRAEILSVAEILKNSLNTITLVGKSVSEAAVKALNLSDFDIIHFAVHGTSDADFPSRSALLLGPGSDETEDDALQPWGIRRLRLNANLVVLSACDTAVGRLLDQEGVSNLVQSFLLAGAHAVVASVWPANDASTAFLMTKFYWYLAQGMDKGSALRQAKLDVLAKYQDKAVPLLWAGIIMLGDSSDSIFGRSKAETIGGNER